MDAPREDDPEGPRFGSAEWDGLRDDRHGHPSGRHVRRHQEEGEAKVSDYVRDGRAADLRSILRELVIGDGPYPPPPIDRWKHMPMLISAGALVLTVLGSSIAIVQSNTRLYDKVDMIDTRLTTVENRQTINTPRLDQQIAENKSQADTINAIRESISEERKQRGADGIENRKVFNDLTALISRLADKVADIDKSVAVMQAPGRRSDGERFERDHDHPG